MMVPLRWKIILVNQDARYQRLGSEIEVGRVGGVVVEGLRCREVNVLSWTGIFAG